MRSGMLVLHKYFRSGIGIVLCATSFLVLGGEIHEFVIKGAIALCMMRL